MIHVPALRAGKPYRSLTTNVLHDVRTGDAVAEVTQVSPGMISRDLRAIGDFQRALAAFTVDELLAISKRAAAHFMNDDLPIGDDTQSVDDYVECLAATTGMPIALGRANMGKIASNLENMAAVLDGLTRGLDLSALDRGYADQDSRKVSYLRQTDSLGAVLPNNSPGVHALWLPAIPLKTPLVLRPGSTEPWTPYRIMQAFMKAGAPPEAFSLYPSGHAGGTEVLLRTGRSLFFGDASTVRAWQGSGKVQVHGPGWSKVMLFGDAAENWQPYLDLMVGSVTMNGGRSCINASGVWTTANGEAIAHALAERLAAIEPLPLDHPEAPLAAFPQPAVARAISDMIDQELHTPGAVDLTTQIYDGDRVVEVGGCTFLRPTVIHCTDPEHALAKSEFGFPFVSVVEVGDADALLAKIGPTLVGTAIGAGDEAGDSTDADSMRYSILTSEAIDRLNLGPMPTYQIAWDQPHEGNLFDHLFQQRAFQLAS